MGQNKKILLIDDSPEIHMMMKIILNQNNFGLISAYSGEEGLEKILAEHPDLVILDYMMPKMSGPEVLEIFVTDDRFRDLQNIPILMLTAKKGGLQEKQGLLQKGLYGYLTKPFGMHELLEVIESTLERAQEFAQHRSLYRVTKKAKDFLDQLVNAIPDAILIVGKEQEIIYFKEPSQNPLDFNQKEVMGKKLEEILELEEGKELSPILAQSATEEVRLEASFRCLNGQKIPVFVTITAMKDDTGEFVGYLLVATDLTEIKRLQSELLEKEKLAVFSETAIAVNHEINNPLAPILGNAQLLLREEDKFDAVSLKRIRSIEKNARRIYSITQRLREIQKPVSKKYVGHSRMLDIHKSE